MKNKALMAALAPCSLLGSVHAIDVKTYLKERNSEESKTILGVYLHGIKDGNEWANAHLTNAGHPKLYCQPPKLVIGREMFAGIVDDYIPRMRRDRPNMNIDDLPLGLVALKALQASFPCEGQ